MRYRILLVAGGLLGTPLALATAQGGHDHAAMHDSAYQALQARGKAAMGVDQERSTHHFTDLPDGGRITLVSDSADTAAVGAIRRHFTAIERAFAAGDFTIPGQVHAQEVPGTDVMKAKAPRITYQRGDVPRGAELRIVTRDPDALRAIHQFLAFQRAEHHAGQ